MKKCIYILLPVHNRREITRNYIDCLVKQTWQNYHLVLIDDGSTDGTEQMVRERIENLTVIRGNGDWWWAGSLQQGFNFLKKEGLSHDDYVLIINDDVVFGKDFFAKGISILDKNKKTLLLAQLQVGENSPPQETGIHADLKTLSFLTVSCSNDINCLPTRGLFLRWGDFVDIGGFHPKILPHFFSDYEFTIRAHKKGYRCLTTPDVIVSQNFHASKKLDLDNSSYFSYLRSFFSKKSYYNPIYQISFIFLTCPVRWLPGNLLKILLITTRISFKYPALKLREMLAPYRIKWNLKKYRDNYKVIIGAYNTAYPGWISTDYPALDITDPDSMKRYFEKESVKAFLAEHVFEHFTQQQTESALAICKDYLIAGGYLRIAVPDGFHPDERYIDYVKPDGFGSGADNHKVLYNYKTLKKLIEKIGFKTKLLEWHDQDGKFHFVDWQPETGFIKRSSRFDERNRSEKLIYTSLIIDAIKPSQNM